MILREITTDATFLPTSRFSGETEIAQSV